MYHIPVYSQYIPRLTTAQMIEVDRLMIEEYHIELIQMMENAGRALALVAKTMLFSHLDKDKLAIVLAGTGGNGRGALVCARRLASWGFPVAVFITDAHNMTPFPQHQLNILKNIGVRIGTAADISMPPQLYEKEYLGISVPSLFRESDVIRLP